jgi:hypothetical protein
MKTMKSSALTLLGTAVLAGAELEINIEIPRLAVAEYHKPYLAVWLEKEDQSFAAHLAVWYDEKKKGREDGTTWLKDLRQWWRKAGRELKVPADGITGATRPPGVQRLAIPATHPAIAGLAPGKYNIVVEAAREVGGRELVRIPFTWPMGGAALQAKGNSELGAISMRAKP